MTVRAIACSLLVVAVCAATGLPAQNSTKKIRTRPGELAAKAGSAVPWREHVDAALAESKRTGKPVFWYVPSVRRSRMDRKPEIDRYMMGGPFSWPSTIELLKQHFVPVRAVARGELAQRHELLPQKFIEPGYVVMDANGDALLRVDQLTTFHPQWFEAPLRRVVNKPREGFPGSGKLARWWDAYRAQPLAELPASMASGGEEMAALFAEMLWLQGAQAFRLGEREAAVALWRQICADFPDQPWAWKAALEVEGHGPFVHGFEIYGELPDAVLAADPHDGTRAPAGVFDQAQLWQRGVAFLATAHDQDGVYRDSTYDFGGTDALPNVHAAISCLVGEALLVAGQRVADGRLVLDAPVTARVEQLLAMMRENASKQDWLALSDRDEILWARAYALRFLQAWKARRGDRQAEAVDRDIRHGVAALLALQPETGVWFHEYGNPFAIATALQALHGAQRLGFDVPQDNIDRGLRALAFNRTADGAFSYGQTRQGRKPRANVVAAACRMPLCELGLFLHGASDQDRLLAAVEAGLTHHNKLAAVRKYDDHADRYGHGGFFFWFDMLGRAEAIAELDDPDKRRQLATAQRQLVMELPEFDGCFVDSHELGRCYGTAMALLCLDVLDRAIH